MNQNLLENTNTVHNNNASEKEVYQILFELIAHLEKKRQGGSRDKIVDSSSKKLDLGRSQTEDAIRKL